MFLNNEKNEKKPLKNHETPGYGYDKSIDDLKVIGQNRTAKKNDNNSADKNRENLD